MVTDTVTDSIEWIKAPPPRQSYCTATKLDVSSAPGISRFSVSMHFDGSLFTVDPSSEWQYCHYLGAAQTESEDMEQYSARLSRSRLGAYDSVLNPVAKPLVDLPVFLYELHDVVPQAMSVLRLLKNLRAKLGNVESCLIKLGWASPSDLKVIGFRTRDKSGYKRYTREQAKAELLNMPMWTLKELSNSLLLVRLGLLPTVSDCKGLYALYNKVEGGFKNLRRVIRAGTVVRASYLDSNLIQTTPTPTGWDQSPVIPWTQWPYLYRGGTTSVRHPACLRQYWSGERGVVSGRLLNDVVISSYDELKSMTGFTQGPLTFGWETLRLSWAFDYFVHVGNALSDLERHQVAVRRNLAWQDGIWISKAVETGVAISRGTLEFDHIVDPRYASPNELVRYRYRTVFGAWQTIEKSTVFTRRPMSSVDSLKSFVIQHKPWSRIKLGTLAALVVSMFAHK